MTLKYFIKTVCGQTMGWFRGLPPEPQEKIRKLQADLNRLEQMGDFHLRNLYIIKILRLIGMPDPVNDIERFIELSDLLNEEPDPEEDLEGYSEYWMEYMAEMGYPVDKWTGEPIGW